MMRLALVVVLLSGGTASAECALVSWSNGAV